VTYYTYILFKYPLRLFLKQNYYILDHIPVFHLSLNGLELQLHLLNIEMTRLLTVMTWSRQLEFCYWMLIALPVLQGMVT